MNRRAVWCLFGLVLLMGLPIVLFETLPDRDTAGIYAPMADAFAEFRWENAFHPAVPCLFPALAGILAWGAGISGFAACKIVSLLLFASCVFPAYALFRRISGSERTALLGTFLCAMCSHMLRYSVSGLRESLKELILFLLALGLLKVYRERESLSGYLLAGAAAGLGTLVRIDMLAFGTAALFAVFVLSFRAEGVRRGFSKPLCAAAAAVLASLPGWIITFVSTGIFLPSARLFRAADFLTAGGGFSPEWILIPGAVAFLVFAYVFSRISIRSGTAVLLAAGVFVLGFAGAFFRPGFRADWGMAGEYAAALTTGFFPYFGVPVLIGILWKFWAVEWRKEDSLLLWFLAAHTGILLLQILWNDGYLYVSRRYLLPAAALSFVWAAYGGLKVLDLLREWRPRIFGKWIPVLFTVILIGLAEADGAMPTVKKYSSRSQSSTRRDALAVGSFLRKDYSGSRRAESSARFSSGRMTYHPEIRPFVCFIEDGSYRDHLWVAAYLGGGSVVSGSRSADYLVTGKNAGAREGFVPCASFERVILWRRIVR